MITRAELESLANRTARALAAKGVGQDDLVTIALPNGVAFVATTIACWKLGAIPQPVSARLPRRELDAIIELAGPRVVVDDAARRRRLRRSPLDACPTRSRIRTRR